MRFSPEPKDEIPEAAAGPGRHAPVLRKRKDKMRAFFDSVAGRLGKDYVPGKSWKGLAEALLRLMPPLVVADLGAGEGASALLLSQRARRVIAVDSSAKMIEVGREQALRYGVKNIDYRLGDMEEIPIGDGEVELVFFSQSLHHALHPERALAEAARILAAGGRIVILDLVRHRFEEARELYADEWLGFSEGGSGIDARECGLHQRGSKRCRQGAGDSAVSNAAGSRRQEELIARSDSRRWMRDGAAKTAGGRDCQRSEHET